MNIPILILTIILINIAQYQATNNNPTWRLGKDTNKEYFMDNANQRNFHEAKDFCEENGGQLPVILSADENYAVWKLIPSPSSIWLGARNAYKESRKQNGVVKSFQWLDGSNIDDFVNFYEIDHPNYDHDGIAMSKEYHGKWHNLLNYGYSCWATVCERDVMESGESVKIQNLELKLLRLENE